MNRRSFTQLSALALPATFLPLRSSFNKLDTNYLEPTLSEHLQEFKVQLQIGLKNTPQTDQLVDKMLKIKQVRLQRFENEQDYDFLFENAAGNTIHLSCQKNKQFIHIT